MIRQIKKQARVFVAILFLFVASLGIGGYILSNQRFYLPAWVPVLGTDFYTVKAELPSGQAIVPGQGQTVNVAGVKIGEVGQVNLEDGKAVVQMQIKDEYRPIYRDASVLLRPKTGLKDMYLALDPGTRSAGELPEGGRLFDVLGTCFRREPSDDPARMQAFHMHEFVHVGTPESALAFRDRWLERSQEMMADLGLRAEPVVALGTQRAQ